MENTPHNTSLPDDLEYLAELGYAHVPVTPQEIDALTKKVKASTFSYNSGGYFALVCLLTGIFIGLVLFFTIYQAPPARLAVTPEPVVPAPKPPAEQALPLLEVLDTVIVTRENFIRPQSKQAVKSDSSSRTEPRLEDSTAVVLSGEVNLSALLRLPLKEEKLKYMANAPVFYIHDLKVTDYRNLYFRSNHFVPVPGISASLAGRETPVFSSLKQEAEYFLHEELAGALLQFKKGRYDRCIRILNEVAAYNKEDVNCDFYLGLCYYHKHNYPQAISLLDKCITSLNNTFLQEAAYYKALCLVESGDTEKGQALLRQIAEEGEFYAEKAKAYLIKE